MKNKIVVILLGLFLLSAFKAEDKVITVFMIGDSTMANKVLTGGNPERGWGQALGGFFMEDVRIDNHAVNGRSSKSFINEGRWDVILNKLKPGDYVIIQFGHNDEKPQVDRHTDPGTTFDANLRKFVNETRSKGGIPILMNSIVRRNFIAPKDTVVTKDHGSLPSKNPEPVEGNILYETHGAYLDSPRNVAKELNVPFVDADKITHNLVEGLGPKNSRKLFMWVEPNIVPAIPQGRQDNTHLNIYGARVVAGLLVDALTKEVPALAKYVRHYDFVVAKDGTGDFFTIQEAINAVPEFRKSSRTTILVRPGIYCEKLVIPECKTGISLLGQTGAIISGNDFANKKNCFGENMGTSGSSSCYIYAPDFYAENITFENTAGTVGQAVACFVSGDRVMFKNCCFKGNQDTLYTYGKGVRQYFENCYIEGNVDFIFGWSEAVFNHCTIHSLGDGYITAPSTDKGQKYGYIFYDCKITGEEGIKTYLSRPWRPYAQAIFIRCELGKQIRPEGWNNWNNSANEKTVNYAEYKCTGEGAQIAHRATFGKQLKNLQNYDITKVMAGTDGWNPVQNGNIYQEVKR